MGISNLPATSASAIPGVGAVVASGFASQGYSSFTLPAGNYIVYAYGTPNSATFISALSNNLTYRMSNSTTAQSNPSYAAIKLTTTENNFTIGNSAVAPSAVALPGTLTNSVRDAYMNGTAFAIAGSDGSNTYVGVGTVGTYYANTGVNSLTTTQAYTGTSSASVWINSTGTVVLAAHSNTSDAYIYSSTNSGVTWASRSVTGYGGNTTAFTYGSGNGYYVAVSQTTSATGNIASSSDAVTWTTRNSSTTSQLFCVGYGNGVYVAGGVTGAIVSSTDSITWAARTATQTTYQWTSIAYGNGIFVIVANNAISGANINISTNGTTWTGVTVSYLGAPLIASYRDALTFVNNTFFLKSSAGNGYIFASTNGTTWVGWADSTQYNVSTNALNSATFIYGTSLGLTSLYAAGSAVAYGTYPALSYTIYSNGNTAIN